MFAPIFHETIDLVDKCMNGLVWLMNIMGLFCWIIANLERDDFVYFLVFSPLVAAGLYIIRQKKDDYVVYRLKRNLIKNEGE